jgi:hypothetical protein
MNFFTFSSHYLDNEVDIFKYIQKQLTTSRLMVQSKTTDF